MLYFNLSESIPLILIDLIIAKKLFKKLELVLESNQSLIILGFSVN